MTKTVVVHAGHLLDVKIGKTLANQTILIQGDKIASVGSDAQVPAGAQVIDLPNATVLPGLIDAHTHLTMNPNFGYSMLGISVPRQALIGAHNARVTLEAGFTTVRNVGAFSYADVALRDAVNAGDVPGPRMLVSGPPLSITGDIAITICCRTSTTRPIRAWPMASRRCSTRRARSSSMERI